jgi:diguanylate cyclase (GGDEF)-like protein
MSTNESPLPSSALNIPSPSPLSDAAISTTSVNEEARIACLESFGIFNHDHFPLLDILAEHAALLCGTSIAAISLLGRSTLIFKSSYGLDLKEISRTHSFCATCIQSRKDFFLIPDAKKDPLYKDNPLVAHEPFISFYASVPLITKRGFAIGCFAVMDPQPRELGEEKIKLLKNLAEVIVDTLEKEREMKESERMLFLEKNVYNKLLKSSATLASMAPSFDTALTDLMASLDPNLGWLSARIRNMQTGGTTGIFYNPDIPEDPELPLIWQKLDTMPSHPTRDVPSTDFINSAPLRPEYSHLSIPVRIRGRLVALLELLYPDHRKTDSRIQEIFNLMAANLAIVAERELVNVELRYKALHDPISGAATRELFLRRLSESLDAIVVESTSEPILFCFDIDQFQGINDDFGYEFGVQLLVAVKERSQRLCREGDFIGRVVGAEFLMLINQTKGSGDLKSLLRRVAGVLNEPYTVGETTINVHVSIGCVVLTDSQVPPEEIIRRAEEAMRIVKRGKQVDTCIADEVILEAFQKRRFIDRKVREAVGSNRLTMYYQPIVEIETTQVVGAEILIRLIERDGSILPAEEFIDGLERTRLLSRVDEWVLSEAIHCLNDHRGIFRSITGFYLSLNLSPEALSKEGFYAQFFSQIQNAGVSPLAIHLEITEQALLPNNFNVMENIRLLHAAGISLSIDDFGTGYSNLAMLKDFPIDTIKIDRSFLRMNEGGNVGADNPLLEAIAGIAGHFGYTMIGEGIEKPEQLPLLQKVGCRYAQGYLYGHPMPLGDFLELLKGKAKNKFESMESKR